MSRPRTQPANRVSTAVRLPRPLLAAYKAEAEARTVSVNVLITSAMEHFLDVLDSWSLQDTLDIGEPHELGAILLSYADALEAAGPGPFVIDHTGAVLGTLERDSQRRFDRLPCDDPTLQPYTAFPLYHIRPSLTEEPQQ